jgi:septal ring factor EnvC (AmiA/AmiB activator)
MSAEKDLEKKIKQKEEETQRLKDDLRATEAYLEGMRASLRVIKKTSDAANGGTIRPGSMIDKARKALRQAGKPLYIEELLRKMGKEVSKKNRISLSGSLGSYVRDKNIFTRPAPNTFGLIEFDEIREDDDVPEGFGQD